MDLRASASANVRRNRAATCPVLLIAEELSSTTEPTRAQWIEAADDDTVVGAGLVRVISPIAKHPISPDGLGRHRRFECACRPKPAPTASPE